MLKLNTIWLVLSFVTTIYSGSSITGIITDSSNNSPIKDAIVMLEKEGLEDTTDVHGTFNLMRTNIRDKTVWHYPDMAIVLRNGKLQLTLFKKSNLEIGAYTLHGKNIFKKITMLKTGAHEIALPVVGNGIYVYRLVYGTNEILFKYSTMGGLNASHSENGSMQLLTTQKAGASTGFIDTLKVVKNGYLNFRFGISEADTNSIVIAMINQDAGLVTDFEGNQYKAIRIGKQIWTMENLRSTKYNDGTPIPHVIEMETWQSLTTPAFCYYDNNADDVDIKKWGALYNWYAVAPSNPDKLTPAGWRVPCEADWDTLQNYLISNGYNYDGKTRENNIGKALATKTDWNSGPRTNPGEVANNMSSNNSSGFSGLPAGCRYMDSRDFLALHDNAYWWMTTDIDSINAKANSIQYYYSNLRKGVYHKRDGMSVRLIRE